MQVLPEYQRKLLQSTGKTNFSLFFSRMTSWKWNDEGDKKIEAKHYVRTEKKKKGNQDIYIPSIEQLGNKSAHLFPSASGVLASVHKRQHALLLTEYERGNMVWEFRCTLRTPYVSGLGSGHPTETGMILDRNTGMPYIPASAIKGVLRLAHALDLVEEHGNSVCNMIGNECVVSDRAITLRRYFGDTESSSDSVRGQLVFLDAFPAELLQLKTDIMNPHFSKYYAGEKGPVETEPPNPIKFLCVPAGTEFVFRCFSSSLLTAGGNNELRRPFDGKDERVVASMMDRAVTQLGLGSKTAVGYGRFTVTTAKKGKDFAADLAIIKAEKENKRREEEMRKYPWRPLLKEIMEVAQWKILRTRYLDNAEFKKFQAEQEVGQKVKEVVLSIAGGKDSHWDRNLDTFMLDWLKPSGVVWEKLVKEAPETKRIDPVMEKVKSYSDDQKAAATYILSLEVAALEIETCKALEKWVRKNWKKVRRKSLKKQFQESLKSRIKQSKNV